MNNTHPVFHLWQQLTPTAWSEVLKMETTERAGTFFIPGVEDLSQISIARKEIFPSVCGAESPTVCRVNTMHKTGNDTTAFSDCVNMSMDWWHSIMWGSIHYYDEVQKVAIRKIWPNVEFFLCKGQYDRPCCQTCSILDGVIVEKFSRLYYEFLPPWHLDCRLHVRQLKKGATSFQRGNVSTEPSRLYNPVDFVEAFGLVPRHQTQNTSDMNFFSRIRRRLGLINSDKI